MIACVARVLLGIALCFAAPLAYAQSGNEIADFYRGKRVTLMISGPAGSGYDVYARLLAQNLGRFIPGNPTIVSQNIPAAAGLVLTNTAYNTGARDGTLLLTLHFNLPLYQAMGGAGVRFDAGKLIALGRLLASNAVIGVASNSKSGVANIEDARKTQSVIGGTGPTSNATIYPTILNNLTGAKFKVVSGYEGENDVFLAMERGELDGFGSYSYLTFKAVKPDYLAKKLFHPIVQWGARREEAWPDTPTAIDIAQTPADKRAMELASAGPDLGFSYFMPPDVPAPRVAALRKAFDDMTHDKEFLAEAARLRMDLRPAPASNVEAIVANVLSAPVDVVARLTQLMDASGAVQCMEFARPELCAKP
jgi:tripartite-type tricarboxylate transporter receptor subunit TctC